MTQPEPIDPAQIRGALEMLNQAAASVAANRETHIRLGKAHELVKGYVEACLTNPPLTANNQKP